MMKKNKLLINFFRILGPIIFLYILSQIDFVGFLSELRIIRWLYLVLAIALLAACVMLKALRWRVILAALEIAISRTEAVSLYWLGIFVGLITPGRVGELSKVYYLKLKGYNFFRSFFSLIFDRLCDIAVILILGFVVSWYYLNAISSYIGLFGLLIALLATLFFIHSERKSRLHKLLAKIISKVFPISEAEYDRFTFARLWLGIKGVRMKEVEFFFAYMLLGWLAYFYARYAVALALGLSLSFMEVMITSVLIAIVSAVPISIAGLGTREAIVIYAFGIFGLNKEVALVFSLLIFSCDSFVTSFGLIPYFNEASLIERARVGEAAKTA